MSLDHLVILVPQDKFDDCVRWYSKALEPLGYTKQQEYPGKAVGFGDFWLGSSTEKSIGIGQHFAFKGKGEMRHHDHRIVHDLMHGADHATVDRFYEVAIAAGGKDNGKPGIRQMYGPHYYGAVWQTTNLLGIY